MEKKPDPSKFTDGLLKALEEEEEKQQKSKDSEPTPQKMEDNKNQPDAAVPVKPPDTALAKGVEESTSKRKRRAARNGEDKMLEAGVKAKEKRLEPEVEKENKEVGPENNLEELKADLDGKRRAYAQLDLDKTRKWTRLKNLLGASIKEIKDEEFDRVWGEYEEAKNKYFEARRTDVISKGDKESAKEFLREFAGADEAIKFLNLKYDLKKEQSGYPAKILYGFEKMANGWREMSLKNKLVVSAAVFGLGLAATATAGMTIGGIGALAFTARTAQRALGAGAMYVGAKKWQDTRAMKKIEEHVEQSIEEQILSKNDWIDRIKSLEYSESSQIFDFQKEKIETLDKKHKRRALALAASIGLIGTTYDTFRTFFPGVGSNILNAAKEKMMGSATSSKIIDEAMNRPMTGAGAQDHVGEITEKYGPEKYWTKGDLETSDSPGISESVRAADMGEKIAELGPRNLATVNIPKGGSMWAGIENSIKANPKAYGLDPEDPGFNNKMHRLTQNMLDKFASQKGLTYEQLDQIARAKIRPGDSFKLVYDSSTHDLYIDDFHGKAFGADVVSHAGATEEIVTGKPSTAPTGGKIVPEDAGPRTGTAATESHVKRPGGKSLVPKEIQDWQDSAKAKYAETVQAEQEWKALKPNLEAENDQNYGIAHVRQVQATGRIINRIFEKAGVSGWSEMMKQPMNHWNNFVPPENYISQDVGQMDDINKMNPNIQKLRNLRPILEKYHTRGDETIAECLFRAMKNSVDVVKINRVL